MHFVRKKTKDHVLPQNFNSRLKVDNTDIIALKKFLSGFCLREKCNFLL